MVYHRISGDAREWQLPVTAAISVDGPGDRIEDQRPVPQVADSSRSSAATGLQPAESSAGLWVRVRAASNRGASSCGWVGWRFRTGLCRDANARPGTRTRARCRRSVVKPVSPMLVYLDAVLGEGGLLCWCSMAVVNNLRDAHDCTATASIMIMGGDNGGRTGENEGESRDASQQTR